ncbi:MAG: biotin--[acetyl-CoA-carboxylase] ligase, partial [Solirubrobacteraceae bacterium]
QGRSWSAPAGAALLCSLVLRDPPALLPLLAGVAVAETVGGQIKWPNDILIGSRKVAGILVEGRPQERWAVVGIGINVAVDIDCLPSELRERAGTLGRFEPGAIELVLDQLLRAVERHLGDPVEALLDAWRSRDALRGQEVAWAGGRGVADGIDGEGRLVVRSGGAGGPRTTLDAGEVHLEPLPRGGS